MASRKPTLYELCYPGMPYIPSQEPFSPTPNSSTSGPTLMELCYPSPHIKYISLKEPYFPTPKPSTSGLTLMELCYPYPKYIPYKSPIRYEDEHHPECWYINDCPSDQSNTSDSYWSDIDSYLSDTDPTPSPPPLNLNDDYEQKVRKLEEHIAALLAIDDHDPGINFEAYSSYLAKKQSELQQLKIENNQNILPKQLVPIPIQLQTPESSKFIQVNHDLPSSDSTLDHSIQSASEQPSFHRYQIDEFENEEQVDDSSNENFNELVSDPSQFQTLEIHPCLQVNPDSISSNSAPSYDTSSDFKSIPVHLSPFSEFDLDEQVTNESEIYFLPHYDLDDERFFDNEDAIHRSSDYPCYDSTPDDSGSDDDIPFQSICEPSINSYFNDFVSHDSSVSPCLDISDDDMHIESFVPPCYDTSDDDLLAESSDLPCYDFSDDDLLVEPSDLPCYDISDDDLLVEPSDLPRFDIYDDDSFDFDDELRCASENVREVKMTVHIPFERRPIDLAIFTFDEPEIEQFGENTSYRSTENVEYDEFPDMDGGEEDYNFLRRNTGRKKHKRLRRIKNKMERLSVRMTKRLTSPHSPMKRTHWEDGKRVRSPKPRKC